MLSCINLVTFSFKSCSFMIGGLFILLGAFIMSPWDVLDVIDAKAVGNEVLKSV